MASGRADAISSNNLRNDQAMGSLRSDLTSGSRTGRRGLSVRDSDPPATGGDHHFPLAGLPRDVGRTFPPGCALRRRLAVGAERVRAERRWTCSIRIG
jgi:hypothetical protein